MCEEKRLVFKIPDVDELPRKDLIGSSRELVTIYLISFIVSLCLVPLIGIQTPDVTRTSPWINEVEKRHEKKLVASF